MVQHLVRDPQKLKMYSDIIIKHEKQVFIERVTHPETTVGTSATISHTMPCLRNLQPPQYASCTNAAVDNPDNTLALMTVCCQGHLLLMT